MNHSPTHSLTETIVGLHRSPSFDEAQFAVALNELKHLTQSNSNGPPSVTPTQTNQHHAKENEPVNSESHPVTPVPILSPSPNHPDARMFLLEDGTGSHTPFVIDEEQYAQQGEKTKRQNINTARAHIYMRSQYVFSVARYCYFQTSLICRPLLV